MAAGESAAGAEFSDLSMTDRYAHLTNMRKLSRQEDLARFYANSEGIKDSNVPHRSHTKGYNEGFGQKRAAKAIPELLFSEAKWSGRSRFARDDPLASRSAEMGQKKALGESTPSALLLMVGTTGFEPATL
jgi:hypothetical protein